MKKEKLGKFFKRLQANKNQLVNAKTGKDFEDKLISILREVDITGLDKEDSDVKSFLQEIKPNVLDKFGEEFINISDLKLSKKYTEGVYIYQPFGSQQYPDFLIILDDKVYPLEIKYSQKKSINPMWNSNLPKGNGIYIFGSYELKDITFFFGKEILPMNERKQLIRFFEDVVKPEEEKFRKQMTKYILEGKYNFSYGFDIYVRRAYQQTRNINSGAILNLFENPYRSQLEDSVIEYFTS